MQHGYIDKERKNTILIFFNLVIETSKQKPYVSYAEDFTIPSEGKAEKCLNGDTVLVKIVWTRMIKRCRLAPAGGGVIVNPSSD